MTAAMPSADEVEEMHCKLAGHHTIAAMEAAAMLRALQAAFSKAMNSLTECVDELDKERARAEKLREALKPFAAIAPSSFYPADGSEAEEYMVLLRADHGNKAEFTGADLAAARAAISPVNRTVVLDDIPREHQERIARIGLAAMLRARAAMLEDKQGGADA